MTTDLVPFDEKFPLARLDPEQLAELITENLGNEAITRFDLELIHVSPGGAPGFVIEQGDDQDSEKTLECVMVHAHPARVFFKKSITEGGAGQVPDCGSQDGEDGLGDIGDGNGVQRRSCLTCPKNVFGTDPKGGKGKACKEFRVLYLYREGRQGLFPSVLQIPPTSLRAFKDYGIWLVEHAHRRSTGIHKLSTTRKESAAGQPYSQIVFEFVRPMSQQEAESIAGNVEAIKGMIEQHKPDVAFDLPVE